jgi:NADH:ubiquinone oxidoreductase subunit 6 (subunit J)
MIKLVIFNIFILLSIIPSFWVAFSNNIVHAAFSLLFTFFGIAGLYVLLGADFIGVVQVIIYIGGILVLIIFGVMMTERGRMLRLTVQLPGRIFAAILSLIILVGLVLAAIRTPWPIGPSPAEPGPTSAAMGELILSKYLIPFEVTALLLLASLVGAVLIVRRSIQGE